MRAFSYRTGLNSAVPSREARALFLILLLMIAACASTPEARTYQTIASCNLTVQTAARAFGTLYQANKASDPVLWGDRYDKAQAAFNSYQRIRDAAVDAAKAGGETTLILATVNEAMNQVLALLASYGVR